MIPLIEFPLLKIIATVLVLIVSIIGYEDVHLYLHKHPVSTETQNIKKNTLENPHCIYIKYPLLKSKENLT